MNSSCIKAVTRVTLITASTILLSCQVMMVVVVAATITVAVIVSTTKVVFHMCNLKPYRLDRNIKSGTSFLIGCRAPYGR